MRCDIRLVAAFMIAACAVVMSGGRAYPQESELRAVDVDVSRYPDVSLTVEVPDLIGGSWTATVEEAGTARPVEVRTGDRGGTEIALVLDTSGSMAGAPIAAAKAAAVAFVRQLPPAARVAVIGFGTSPYVVSPMTADAAVLEAAISGLRAGGETALYDALGVAVGQFSLQDIPRSVVLVSDGGDTQSMSTLPDVTARLVEAKVQVFGLRLLTGETNDEVLADLAAVTHGRTADAADPASLAGTYEAIASSALRQVRLTYRSAAHGTTPVRVELDSLGVVRTVSLSVPLPDAPATTSTTTVARHEGGAALADAPDQSSMPLLVGGAAVFAGLFALASRVLVRPRRSLLTSGHRSARSANLRALKDRFGAAMERTLERRGRRDALGVRLENAGITLRPGEYVVMTSAVAALGVVCGLLLGGLAVAVVFAMLVVAVALLLLELRTAKRRAALERQLPDLLQQLTSSLRAGYGIMQAFDAVAREAEAPTCEELRRVVHEVQLGRPLVESLERMADRVGGEDFGWVVQAIDINHEVGGDLVEVLDAVADTIRARARLRRHIRTLSAQGRLSARILLSMPFAMAVVLSFLHPGWLSPFFEPGIGPMLLVVGAVMMTVGWLWMRRIARLQF